MPLALQSTAKIMLGLSDKDAVFALKSREPEGKLKDATNLLNAIQNGLSQMQETIDSLAQKNPTAAKPHQERHTQLSEQYQSLYNATDNLYKKHDKILENKHTLSKEDKNKAERKLKTKTLIEELASVNTEIDAKLSDPSGDNKRLTKLHTLLNDANDFKKKITVEATQAGVKTPSPAQQSLQND